MLDVVDEMKKHEKRVPTAAAGTAESPSRDTKRRI